MRKFLVNVNGTSYEVEVEEIGGSVPVSPNPASEVKAPAVAPAKKVKSAAKPVSASAEKISAPMPGTIISINVNPGDSFKSGQVLVVLEAMKMENEILAPRDGVVVAVNASKGSSVNSGDVLIAFE